MTTVADIMQVVLATVAPECPIPEIEALFTKYGISALPVVDDGELVGILSTSDIIRQICVERSVSEVIAEYDWDISGFHEHRSDAETMTEVAERLGRRVDHLTAADVMTAKVVSVEPDAPVARAARLMLDNRIHRLPIVREAQLVGLVSTMDIVRYVAGVADQT
jgi:CBS domain-containing protein